jgi:hypothetical protein
MKKQTAVECLALYIKGITTLNCDEVIAKAKAMEKEQLSDAWYAGDEDGAIHEFEQYYTSTYTNEDDSPEPNEALKLAKERYDKHIPPYVSDDFQIGPDGAFEDVSDWDVTLMDGIEYESWDEIYEDYAGEADLHEFLQWLKNNFQVPNKLGPQNS